jgi:hypothetical protein
MATAYVKCLKDGEELITYDFGYADNFGVAKPTHESLVNEAKSQLTTDRLAFPPYDDVTFRVTY